MVSSRRRNCYRVFPRAGAAKAAVDEAGAARRQAADPGRMPRVFRTLSSRSPVLAAVLGADGRLAGLVTMEDVLRELFGRQV